MVAMPITASTLYCVVGKKQPLGKDRIENGKSLGNPADNYRFTDVSGRHYQIRFYRVSPDSGSTADALG